MRGLRSLVRWPIVAGAAGALLVSLALTGVFSDVASAGQFHTVTFAENDSGADSVYATETEQNPTALTAFANLSPTFSNPGYTFVDWNTQPDGSGTSYSDGQSYDFSAALILYAIWTGQFHTVTFAENDSGADSVYATETEQNPTALTSFANLSPTFSNPGYSFVDWNTQANGGGTSYSDGAVFGFSSALEIYAIWQAVPNLTASFNPGAGSGSVAPYVGAPGSSFVMPSGSGLSDAGYVFSGWNTNINGTGSEYQPGASVVISSNETFYAQWTQAQSQSQGSSVQITFDDNGGLGTLAPLGGQVGSSVVLPASSALTNSGFSLTSWNTAADGSGVSFEPGKLITLTTSLTLYAQWSSKSQIVITFATNGGSGSPSALGGVVGAIVTLPTDPNVIRSGYAFDSWNTDSDGKGTSYAPGATVTLTSSLTLYAQWKVASVHVLYGAVGLFTKESTVLSGSLKTQVDRLAAAIRSKKYTTVTLFGYTAQTGLASLNRSVSAGRAESVATYLRSRLNAMAVKGVQITATGEGAIAGSASPLYSRVEVFLS